MSEISRSEYRAALKFLTLEKQPANNIYERLVNVYGDSARLIQLSPGGLLNLNVAEHRLKMTPELDCQSKQPLMIVVNNIFIFITFIVCLAPPPK